MQEDMLYLQNHAKPSGEVLPTGYYQITGLNDINAIYKLENNKITVVDHGDLSREAGDISAMMSEAPLHSLIVTGGFDGAITLQDHPDVVLSFSQNLLM